MYQVKTRKGQANLYKTDKNTYAVNLPIGISKEIFNKPRKRIPLYLSADSRESTVKALQHVEAIQSLLDTENWQGLTQYEESLKPRVVKGNFATKVTLQNLWHDYIKAKQQGWEISYIEGDIKATTKMLEKIPDVYLDDQLDSVINYLMEATTIKQVKRHLKQLSACLTWGRKRKLIKDNPLPDFISTLATRKQNNEDNEICPFTIEERDAIIKAFRLGTFERYKGTHTQYADYLEFLFLSGVRTSEALGLRWEHIDMEKKIIYLQEARVLAISGKKQAEVQKKGLKTQKRRLIPMSNRLYELLATRKSNCLDLSNNVFSDIDHHTFRSSAYKNVLAKLGIAYRKPYQARHTFITILANNSDLKLHQVAKICGTSTNVIEEHYLATNVDVLRLPDV